MSTNPFPVFVAAAVHAAPVFMSRDATVDKMDGLVAEARRRGAQLVVFPESFVPGFPVWALVHPPIDQHRLFRRFYEQSVDIQGPDVARMSSLARRHAVYLSVGVAERSPISMGCLYNTNLLFDPEGTLIRRHRKIVPTWAEKLVWAGGDGAGLRPVATTIGRVGALICGENTNPLARYALLAQGEQVHISTYPPVWPFRREPEVGSYQRWIELRASAHSFEGKVFTVVSAGCLDEQAILESAAGDARAEATLRAAQPAASMIVGADGEALAGPCHETDELVLSTIDIGKSIESKLAHDVVGNYQRFDLLRLQLDQRAQPPIVVLTDPGGDRFDQANRSGDQAGLWRQPPGTAMSVDADPRHPSASESSTDGRPREEGLGW